MSAVTEHAQAARSYARYALTLTRAGQPERAGWWRELAQMELDTARMIKRREAPRTGDGPSTGPCDTCGHKDGHRIPGGELICEPCFYTFDPEADYTHGG